ncbi:MAG: xanthine dehydrogenase family protein molybdopterin-binding subunit [Deltaproteobacteria bacterium]|nr:xanthine dehydrogenase family protein molybdopterin-binding subunit [Deltaproteobacteria bacterium]
MMLVVGRPTPRVEGELKVTGKAQYSADLKLPNILWGRCLRSPISYGRIKSIDISKALQVPGVKAVITGKDVPGLRIGRCIYDTPVVADGVVRFIGEKVAAVAAETKSAAEQALDLIEVEYDELEPLLDPLEAVKPSAPILHPDLLSYRGLPVPVEKLSNVFSYLKWGKGNLEAGFKQADLIVENTYTTQVTHQSYLEPHACVAKTDPSGGADIWSCSKTPFAVRTQLSNCIGLAKEKLIFHPMHIGGDFGGKGGFMDVPVAYFLSLKSGQPVKMLMDYTEELTAGNPRHASIIKIKTGVKKNGAIVAHHLDFVFDSGAYGSMKPAGYLIGASTCAGPYKIANCLIEERMVYTNKIPCGHMRAPGDPQGFFANESQFDMWRASSAWTRRSSSARTCCATATRRPSASIFRTFAASRRWTRPSSYRGIKNHSRRTSGAVWPFPSGARAAVKATCS